MKKILFVCTGNTFRSASADYLFDKYSKMQSSNSYIVSSAGTLGNPVGVYEKTIEMANKYGVDMSAHTYRVLTQDIVDDVDIIICMAHHHQETVKQKFGKESYLFNELSIGEKTDLKDDDEAYGEYADLDDFIVETVETIYERIPALYEKLQQMNL